MPRAQRIRNFCFTINNYSEQDYKDIKRLDSTYFIYGKEVGASGTPHLQGYMELKDQLNLQQIKKVLTFAHIEARKGTAKQASDYCKKDNDFTEEGEMSTQGKRIDIEGLAELVTQGCSNEQIKDLAPVMVLRFQKGINDLRNAGFQDRDQDFPPKVVWLWGSTGCGKTEEAQELGRPNTFTKDHWKWWDNYTQQKRIVVDDFNAEWPFRNWLRFLDKYPYSGQVKCSYVKINSPEIYITSEFPPSHYYQGTQLAQVLRRINEVKEKIFDPDYEAKKEAKKCLKGNASEVD